MNRNVGIATAVGIAIIIGVIGFQIYDSSYQRSSVDEFYEDANHNDDSNVKHVVYPPNPQTLRGVTITKDKYLLGENVFVSVQNIPPGLKDALLFYTPEGKRYLTLGFDGDEKSSFKHYFRPSLLKSADICHKEKLIGKWDVFFAGLSDERIHFEVTSETLPGSEAYYVACGDALEFPGIEPSLIP
jgi:hypothetical protein